MPQTLICAIDDSDRAYEAVSVACDLAQRLDLPLMLAHVVEEPLGYPFGESEEMESERRQRLARGTELLHHVATTLDLPSDVEMRTESGEPSAMLQTLAEEERAALLVVASRGRGRIRSALFGSVSGHLIDGLPCPMLVVTPGAATRYRAGHELPDAAVVCGIDGATAVEQLVPLAAKMADRLHARLLLVHAELPAMSTSHGIPSSAGASIAGAPLVLHDRVDEHQEAARRQLERAEQLATTSRVEARVELGEIGTTMATLAEDTSVQLLAVAQNSSWQLIASRAGCPVLVVPAS